MTAPDPRRTVVTGQLVGRWIVDLVQLIRNPDAPDIRDLQVAQTWDSMSDGARHRLGEIGNDLLVKLDDHGLLVGLSGRAILKRVTRDHLGRPLGSPPPAGALAGSAPTCRCGKPETLGTVHRLAGPCYLAEGSIRAE
jgi:hypothetical protein